MKLVLEKCVGSLLLPVTVLVGWLVPCAAPAVTTIFFNSSQTTNLVSTNASSDTLSSEDYLFTYTRDKLFTGGTGNVIGRPVRVFWPDGLEAQYVTTATNKARITVRRVDGTVFDLTAFSAKLLANAGAGRDIEIVPLLNGEEPLNDPLYFDVSGNSGNVFSYDTTPNPFGSTAALTNYDAYHIDLTLDYALMSLTVVDASLPRPRLDIVQVDAATIELSWPASAVGYGLEFTPALSAPAWSPVTNDIVQAGEIFSVQVGTSDAARLYRLRK